MYGSSYPHTLEITRASSDDGQDPNTGLPDPQADPEIIYQDGCDAQEFSAQRQSGLMVTDSGDYSHIAAELVIYLEDEEPITDIRIGDTGTLKGRGTQEQIKVVAIKKIDGSIYANRI